MKLPAAGLARGAVMVALVLGNVVMVVTLWQTAASTLGVALGALGMLAMVPSSGPELALALDLV